MCKIQKCISYLFSILVKIYFFLNLLRSQTLSICAEKPAVNKRFNDMANAAERAGTEVRKSALRARIYKECAKNFIVVTKDDNVVICIDAVRLP